jgi:large subunit ribosomal protein L3
MPTTKGILGEKLGMTQIFVETHAVPVTVIKAGPCYVTQVKSADGDDGYDAVQLAYGARRANGGTKPSQGHLDKAGVEAGRHLVELRTDDAATYELGQELKADVFAAGDTVDVVGVSRGKGFSGVMKRHGFSGLRSSHGVKRKHRSPGAIGACATPSRVFKGMRMAGQQGSQRVTMLNLEIVQSDPERNLLLVKGAIPGPAGGLVMVREAVKAPTKKGGLT